MSSRWPGPSSICAASGSSRTPAGIAAGPGTRSTGPAAPCAPACLEVCDGVFDGCAGLAERGVVRALTDVEIGAGESLVRDDVDPLDADVAQVGEGGMVGEDGGQT